MADYEWLKSKTANYNPNAPMYGNMPQMANFPASMPGFQGQVANQLQQGFGTGADQFTNAMAQMYRPVGVTQLSEPLTQTMRAFGIQHTGQPGQVEKMDGGFNPQGYQQWGMQTGSPWLDAMFGLNPAAGVAGQGGTVTDPKKKKKSNNSQTPVPVSNSGGSGRDWNDYMNRGLF